MGLKYTEFAADGMRRWFAIMACVCATIERLAGCSQHSSQGLLAMRYDYAPMFRAAQQEVRKMIREIYYFLGYGPKVQKQHTELGPVEFLKAMSRHAGDLPRPPDQGRPTVISGCPSLSVGFDACPMYDQQNLPTMT
jgi:hypothetical protein